MKINSISYGSHNTNSNDRNDETSPSSKVVSWRNKGEDKLKNKSSEIRDLIYLPWQSKVVHDVVAKAWLSIGVLIIIITCEKLK